MLRLVAKEKNAYCLEMFNPGLILIIFIFYLFSKGFLNVIFEKCVLENLMLFWRVIRTSFAKKIVLERVLKNVIFEREEFHDLD